MIFETARIALLAAAMASTPALAGEVKPGDTVYGPQGNEVGTIEQVSENGAVLDTGKHKVPLQLQSFGESEKGPTITVTREQLNQMMDQQLAEAARKRDEALVEGAAVTSADNQPLGTIQSIDSEKDVIVIERDNGLVSLKREHFAVNPAGQLIALFTLEQIEAATVGQ